MGAARLPRALRWCMSHGSHHLAASAPPRTARASADADAAPRTVAALAAPRAIASVLRCENWVGARAQSVSAAQLAGACQTAAALLCGGGTCGGGTARGSATASESAWGSATARDQGASGSAWGSATASESTWGSATVTPGTWTAAPMECRHGWRATADQDAPKTQGGDSCAPAACDSACDSAVGAANATAALAPPRIRRSHARCCRRGTESAPWPPLPPATHSSFGFPSLSLSLSPLLSSLLFHFPPCSPLLPCPSFSVPSLPFPFLSFPSLSFPSLPFPSFPVPPFPFASLPFPYLTLPYLTLPNTPSRPLLPSRNFPRGIPPSPPPLFLENVPID